MELARTAVSIFLLYAYDALQINHNFNLNNLVLNVDV